MYPELKSAELKRGPEPTEEELTPVSLGTETLMQASIDPSIKEALAAEGLEIDQTEVNRLLEEGQRREELETALHLEAKVEVLDKTFVEEPRPTGPVTREEFENLKEGINSSFMELASLLLEGQRTVEEILARLDAHNKRGGHKI